MSFGFLKKLRLVDYLIILAVLLAGVILFKFLNPEEKWIYASVAANNVPLFQTQALHVGDFEKDSTGEKIAEIINIQTYETPKTLTTEKDIFIRTKILVKINPRSGEFEYKNKIVKIGSPIDFRFNSGQISGKVADLGSRESGQKNQRETKILTLKIYSQWPWMADNLTIGGGEKDESGQNIVEILSKEVTPAEMTVTTSTGETLLRTDPRKVDITLKAKILVQKLGDELVLRQDEKIAIGEQISFHSGNLKIENAFVTNIE